MSSLNRTAGQIRGNRFQGSAVRSRGTALSPALPAARYYLEQCRTARLLFEEILVGGQKKAQREYPELRAALRKTGRRLRLIARLEGIIRPGAGSNRLHKVFRLGLGWYVLIRITKVVDLGWDFGQRRPLPHSFLRPDLLRAARAGSGFSWSDFASQEKTKSLFCAFFPSRLWDGDLYQWLRSHLSSYLLQIPDEFAQGNSFGKLVRCMLGTVFFRTTTLNKRSMGADALKKELSLGFKAGFWYGVTYMFDDIMDSDYYSEDDKRKIFNYLAAFLSGKEQPGPVLSKDASLAEFLFSALVAIGELRPDDKELIFKTFYTLTMAQLKEYNSLRKGGFSWEGQGHLLMIKAACTRIIAALLAGLPVDREYNNHALASGLAIQLLDDLRDVGSDLAAGTNTPFTALAREGSIKDDRRPLLMCCAAMAHVSGRFAHPQKALEAWTYKLTFALRESAGSREGDRRAAQAVTTGLPALDRALARAARAPAGINMSELIIRETSRAGAEAREYLLGQERSGE